jgi:hypothetical protein
MSLADKLRATTASIAEAHALMEEDTKDAKQRFFAFVDTHNIPLGYVDYPWSPGHPANILEDVDSFYLCTGYDNKDGITFAHDIYDGTESVTIPYDYFDDADAWEAKTLAEIAADRKVAEDVVAGFSEAGEFFVEAIRLDGGYGGSEYSISAEVGFLNRPDDFYGINEFISIRRSTGEIAYASKKLIPVLAEKGIEVKA